MTQLHNLKSDNISCVMLLLLECGNGGIGGDEEKRQGLGDGRGLGNGGWGWRGRWRRRPNLCPRL